MSKEKIVAFDIDGALDEEGGMFEYQDIDLEREMSDGKIVLGIVSARPQGKIDSFTQENQLSPDFAKSTSFKTLTLRELKKEYSAGTYKYFGSWMRDRVAAKLAGWEYEQI